MKPYSKAIISLLKRTVEKKSSKSSSIWQDILNYQNEIQEYLSVIGLELIIKKDEGFAYLKQIVQDDDTTMNLVSRKPLSFENTVVLIVLRHILEEYDTNPIETQSTDKIISHQDIKDEVKIFLPEKYDKEKFEKDLDSYIQNMIKLGYLKELDSFNNERHYRIHRIIKEKVTIDDINSIKKGLEEYANRL